MMRIDASIRFDTRRVYEGEANQVNENRVSSVFLDTDDITLLVPRRLILRLRRL